MKLNIFVINRFEVYDVKNENGFKFNTSIRNIKFTKLRIIFFVISAYSHLVYSYYCSFHTTNLD